MPLIDSRYYRLDDLLRRPYTPKTPFGATGACLWATSPQGWGFREGVHWVHKTGENGLSPFTLAIRADGRWIEPEGAVYRPSHVTLHAVDLESGLQMTEDKFITTDDVVVSVLSLRNPNDSHIAVRIDHTYGIPAGFHEFRPGLPVYVYREGPPSDDLRIRLHAFAMRTLVFAVGFGKNEEEARRRVWCWRNHLNPVEMQRDEYQDWFDANIPGFDCSDPWFTKMWYHRWYLVKKNHCRPEMGRMLEDTFVQGRWQSDEHTATNLATAPYTLREVRWLRDPKFVHNYFHNLARNQREDGRFRSFYVDKAVQPKEAQTGAIITGVWQSHLVHPDPEFLRVALLALQKNLAALHAEKPLNHETLQGMIRICTMLGLADAATEYERVYANLPDARLRREPFPSVGSTDEAWPHNVSNMALGFAHFLQQQGHDGYDGMAGELYRIIENYGRAQFEEGNFERPCTGECYQADTGPWLTEERDQFYSTWADMILTFLIGIVPREDDVLEIHPLLPAKAWTHFCAENVPYHGRLLTLVWDDPTEAGDAYDDGDKGFTVYIDGRRFYHQNDLSPFKISLYPEPVEEDDFFADRP